jgi:adenylosuccinate synthase
VTKIGPVSDKSVYTIAKTFAERVGKGEIQAKPEAQEAKRKPLSL